MLTRLTKYKTFTNQLVFVLAAFLFTFPEFDLAFKDSLDSGYVWALNHFFAHDFEKLTHLIYPLGPLGFLLFPTYEGANLWYALIFYSLTKLVVLCCGLQLVKKHSDYLLLFFVAFFLKPDTLLVSVVILLNVLYFTHRKLVYPVLAIVFTVLGVFMKSSIGIICFSSFISLLVLMALYYRVFKSVAILLFSFFVVYFLFGLLLFGDTVLLIQYTVGVFKLSVGYSAALALYPDNNWLLMGLVIATLLAVPVVLQSKRTIGTYLLFVLPLFFTWKHSMIRQDVFHHVIFLYFMLFFWGIMLIVSGKKKTSVYILATIAILAYYSNASHLPFFKGYQHELIGINNFTEVVFESDSLRSKAERETTRELQTLQLDSISIQLIGNSRVDIYPWNVLYAAVNKLNWRVRPTLQSGAFSQWVDATNAAFFRGENSPEFVIFHFSKADKKNELASFDNRYVLNDEPQTIHTIFDNYSIKHKTADFLLLQKRTSPLFKAPIAGFEQTIAWNTWIPVRTEKEVVQRVKVQSDLSVCGSLKSTLYKEGAYYIDYQLADTIVSYRYVRDNAQEGLWLTPFLFHTHYDSLGKEIKRIRFRCDDMALTTDSLMLVFETLPFDNSPVTHKSYHPFTSNRKERFSAFCQKIVDFETKPTTTSAPAVLTKKGKGFKSLFANKVEGNSFSYSVEMDLEKIWSKADTGENILVTTSVDLIAEKTTEVIVVMALKKKEQNFWKSNPAHVDQPKIWKTHTTTMLLDRKIRKGTLVFYVWNNNKPTVLIDNFTITLKQETK